MASNPEPAFVWDDSDDETLAQAAPEAPAPLERRSGSRRDRGLLAVFAGLYAAWSIAWVLAIVAAPTQPASSALDAVMYQFGEFLALIATPLWLGATWWLTSDAGRKTRVFLLVAGLLILVPLPLILPAVAS